MVGSVSGCWKMDAEKWVRDRTLSPQQVLTRTWAGRVNIRNDYWQLVSVSGAAPLENRFGRK